MVVQVAHCTRGPHSGPGTPLQAVLPASLTGKVLGSNLHQAPNKLVELLPLSIALSIRHPVRM